MFAGSCIGVILLVILLEGLRRLGREYDAFIFRRARIRHIYLTPPSNYADRENKPLTQKSPKPMPRDIDVVPDTIEHVLALPNPSGEVSTQEQGSSEGTNASLAGEPSRSTAHDAVGFGPYRPSFVEQIVRALLHTMQFAVAYFIMLLAMYYNGYIIICIFIGAYVGSFIFSWEALSLAKP
ncbi:Ctr copper transporter family protein [Penicillium malachiteum]|nr:Ctr copper transporter family protein [Penicillium malachiteum]